MIWDTGQKFLSANLGIYIFDSEEGKWPGIPGVDFYRQIWTSIFSILRKENDLGYRPKISIGKFGHLYFWFWQRKMTWDTGQRFLSANLGIYIFNSNKGKWSELPGENFYRQIWRSNFSILLLSSLLVSDPVQSFTAVAPELLSPFFRWFLKSNFIDIKYLKGIVFDTVGESCWSAGLTWQYCCITDARCVWNCSEIASHYSAFLYLLQR